MTVLLVLLGVGLLALGLAAWLSNGSRGRPPRKGLAYGHGLGSAREITETREALEAEDLAQLLEAHNARRRRRGEPERTVVDVELQLVREAAEHRRRLAAPSAADLELDELLAATNARRRARGLPERSREDVRREFGA